MGKIIVRQYRNTDENSILNICYRTGYMGEDLSNTNKFNDKKLFGYLFCTYYPRYEPENCFVAVDENNAVIGYVLGSMDSKKQVCMFVVKMIPKIIFRLIMHTIWVHPESIRAICFFTNWTNLKSGPANINKQYPAHLHINVLPEFQKSGVGSRLINAFENYLRENRVKGVHLRTSNKNTKAIPFYSNKNYKIIYEKESLIWKGECDCKSLYFAKELV